MSGFHAEVQQATAGEGLAQGPRVAARAGLTLTTLRTKGVESTNEPPRPTNNIRLVIIIIFVHYKSSWKTAVYYGKSIRH